MSHIILPPISLYIHVPWCVKKCPYCDFNSHTQVGALPEDDYIDALIEDFEQQQSVLQGRSLSSIFIGGGTPSLLSGKCYQRLLDAINQRCPLPQGLEITLEANPGTFELKKFRDYAQAGINRLSIGVQSFNDQALEKIGRIHTGNTALRAFEAAQAAGIDNVNIDIMFGLPDQPHDAAMKDLKTAISLAPAHLSWYQLTLEPNTYFFNHPPPLPDEDTLWTIYNNGRAYLAAAGYEQYEVSAYAKTAQSKHNLNYWCFGDYLGIGAGAHSKITETAGTIWRANRLRSPKHYLNRQRGFVAEKKVIAEDDRPFEYMLNALRLMHGSPLANYAARTGCALKDIEPILTDAIRKGWLVSKKDWLQATPLGHQFLNDLTVCFLPDHD